MQEKEGLFFAMLYFFAAENRRSSCGHPLGHRRTCSLHGEFHPALEFSLPKELWLSNPFHFAYQNGDILDLKMEVFWISKWRYFDMQNVCCL
jgi:hypothetical protein